MSNKLILVIILATNIVIQYSIINKTEVSAFDTKKTSDLNKLKSYVEFYFHYIKMLDEFILINSKYKKKNIKTRIEQIKSTLKAFMIKNEKNKIILLKIIQLVLKDDKKILKKKLALNQINSINGFWG
jgi:hypothetical protein